MAPAQLEYKPKSDFRGRSISRHKSGKKRDMMGAVTQDQTVVWPTLCFPVPPGNPHIFEVHAHEYKIWT
jgi:hypothetical protein